MGFETNNIDQGVLLLLQKKIKALQDEVDALAHGGGGGGSVDSVNGQTGVVVLDKTDIGLSNVDNVRQYSASNPPPQPNLVYCVCSTSANVAAKEAIIASGSLDELTVGAQALVMFSGSNMAASPTLKVGNTAAKSIKRYGSVEPSSTASGSWNAGSVVLFVYDGVSWQMVGWINTTYSTMPENEAIAGTATTDRLITALVLKKAVETHAPVQSVNGQTGTVSIDIPSGVAVQDDTPIDDTLVWVDTDDNGAFHTIPEVDDASVSSSDTWSSQKIGSMFSSGTDDGWTYIKIGSTCFAWYYRQRTGININTQWVSGLYRSGEIEAAPYPTFLQSGYQVSASLAVGSQSAGVGLGRIMDSGDALRTFLTSPTSLTGANCAIMVYAFGAWAG